MIVVELHIVEIGCWKNDVRHVSQTSLARYTQLSRVKRNFVALIGPTWVR